MASMLRVAARRFTTSSNPVLRQAAGAHEAHGHDEANLWKKAFLFIAVPAMGFCTYNGFFSDEAKHEHAQPEFVPYNHLRLRVRAFPWGDGNHSLFHSHYNPLPEGYEESDH